MEQTSKEYKVTCIIKPNRETKHQHITHIGDVDQKWMLTRETVIQRIDNGIESYHMVEASSGKKMHIGVVRETSKVSYLRTTSKMTIYSHKRNATVSAR